MMIDVILSTKIHILYRVHDDQDLLARDKILLVELNETIFVSGIIQNIQQFKII